MYLISEKKTLRAQKYMAAHITHEIVHVHDEKRTVGYAVPQALAVLA